MDLTEYRNSPQESDRIADLMNMLAGHDGSALDVGARDGFVSIKLAERYAAVTALDLEVPKIPHERVKCVKGNVTALEFQDFSFDLVLCAEVLEHVAPSVLVTACSELGRVAKEYVLVGVPYRQDIRSGRTTCLACGRKNPPWAHVNAFDESRIESLFPSFNVARVSYVGTADADTNWVSTVLMDLAGNPYGTYGQEEPCIHCGAKLQGPPKRNLSQRMATRVAVNLTSMQARLTKRHANWIHVLLKRKNPGHAA